MCLRIHSICYKRTGCAKRCLDVFSLQMLLINIKHGLLLKLFVRMYFVYVVIWQTVELSYISKVMQGGDDPMSLFNSESLRL